MDKIVDERLRGKKVEILAVIYSPPGPWSHPHRSPSMVNKSLSLIKLLTNDYVERINCIASVGKAKVPKATCGCLCPNLQKCKLAGPLRLTATPKGRISE